MLTYFNNLNILDTFLILLMRIGLEIRKSFFQYDNAFCHVTKSYFQERHIKSLIWPMNSLNLNSFEIIVAILKEWSMTRLNPAKLICQTQFEKIGISLIENIGFHFWISCFKQCWNCLAKSNKVLMVFCWFSCLGFMAYQPLQVI